MCARARVCACVWQSKEVSYGYRCNADAQALGLFLYSPTLVIHTSVIRNLDYPNAVTNVESVQNNGILTKIADSETEQST